MLNNKRDVEIDTIGL